MIQLQNLADEVQTLFKERMPGSRVSSLPQSIEQFGIMVTCLLLKITQFEYIVF